VLKRKITLIIIIGKLCHRLNALQSHEISIKQTKKKVAKKKKKKAVLKDLGEKKCVGSLAARIRFRAQNESLSKDFFF